MQLSDQKLNVLGFLQSAGVVQDKIQSDYIKSIEDYIQELDSEIQKLETDLSEASLVLNHWDTKVAECKAQYEESERRIKEIPTLVSEKQSICSSETNKFNADNARKLKQIQVIDSVISIAENNLSELQGLQ